MPRLLILILVPIFLGILLRIKSDLWEGQFAAGEGPVGTPGPSDSGSRSLLSCPIPLFDPNDLTKGIQS
jgi:hypothetical protein